MSHSPVPGGLHPNLARIAAAYDIVLEEHAQRKISVADARLRIAALETRDDQGIRWSIDPDTGRFVRTKADGTQVFDTPPEYGFATHDAFSYTHPDPFSVAGGDGPRVEDPNARLALYAVEHQQLPHTAAHPGHAPDTGALSALLDALRTTTATPVGAAAALVVAFALLAMLLIRIL